MKQEFTKQIVPRICVPDSEKTSMLRELKKSGILLGCCSNSMSEMVNMMLKSADIVEYFDVVIGNDEVKNPKPDPEMYIRAMQQLGVSPKETVIVEDSQYGIAAAKASGATVIKVQGTKDVHLGLFSEIL
jgi:beta-phosphoglucomutase